MAVARQRAYWYAAAAIVAKIHNVNQIEASGLIRDLNEINPFAPPKVIKKRIPRKIALADFAKSMGNALRPATDEELTIFEKE